MTTDPSVEIRLSTLESMLVHARDALPNECCGLLLGTCGRIEQATRTRNLKPSPTRYQIDPVDHFAAIRSARAEGLQVIGAYHSHPNAPAEPSATDLAEAHDDTLLFVIVSPDSPLAPNDEVGAFRMARNQFSRVTLAVREDVLPRTT